MKSDRLINILVDFAFKKVFAGEGEKSKYLLKDFLNCILELKGLNKIKEITYLNPFNDRDHAKDKQSIMDIKVKTEADELIDIEVQISDVDDYKKRSLYYWSKLYGETIEKGKAYIELKKSIVINILDFNIIDENDKYHNVFVIKEKDDNFKFIDDLEIHYIELDKFKKEDIEGLSDLEEWIIFLRECNPNGNKDILQRLRVEKEEINMATEIIDKLSADEREYQEYLAREKYIMDEISKKRYAEIKRKELEDKIKQANEQLMNSEAKLMDSEAKLMDSEAKLMDSEAKLMDSKAKLMDSKVKLRESEAKLMDSKVKLRESEEKIRQTEERVKQSEEKARKSEKTVVKLIKELLKAGISEEVISINTGLDIDEINKIKP